jgi:hypothetical protein
MGLGRRSASGMDATFEVLKAADAPSPNTSRRVPIWLKSSVLSRQVQITAPHNNTNRSTSRHQV